MIHEKTFVELSGNPLNVLNFGCEPPSSQSSRGPEQYSRGHYDLNRNLTVICGSVILIAK